MNWLDKAIAWVSPETGLRRLRARRAPGLIEDAKEVLLKLFDADADGPRATKVTVPESELSVPAGGFIRPYRVGPAVGLVGYSR